MARLVKIEVDDLISASDAARLLGVRANVISNWQQRLNFPRPVATVAKGKIKLFSKSEVISWYRGRLSPELLAALSDDS
jgi:hypothetical protein